MRDIGDFSKLKNIDNTFIRTQLRVPGNDSQESYTWIM